MTDHLKEYLDKIIFKIIDNKKNKEDIRCELSDHIENLYTDFLSEGNSSEQAEHLVIHAMGEPGKIAGNFSKIAFKIFLQGQSNIIAKSQRIIDSRK